MKKIALFLMLFPALLLAQDIANDVEETNHRLTVSIDEVIKVYPNPFKNHITVVSDGYEFESTLFDAFGKNITIEYTSDGNIDTQDIASGVYFLKVNLGNSEKVYKLIKE